MKFRIRKRFFSLMLVASLFINLFTTSIVSRAAGYDINAAVHHTGTLYEEQKPAPKISDVKVTPSKDISGYTVTCKVDNARDIDRVEFPTWTANNGKDDLIWHKGHNLGYGVFAFTVDVKDHNGERGRYYTHIYAWNIQGKSTCDNSVYVDVPYDGEGPVVSDVIVESINSNGFDVSYVVDSKYEINRSEVVIYYEGRPRMLTASLSDGRYRLHYDLKANGTGSGQYVLMDIWTYNAWGMRENEYCRTYIDVPATTVNVTSVSLDKADSSANEGKSTKVKAGKKKFTVTFHTASNVDGYQIQYATSKNFKSAKTKTISAKKESLTVKKLKSKKTYYVRIRTYKNSALGKLYSEWGKVKKIKTK